LLPYLIKRDILQLLLTKIYAYLGPSYSAFSNHPNEITLSWTDPCDNRTCDDDRTADYYEIFYHELGINATELLFVADNSSRETKLLNLQTNTKYSIKIRTTSGSTHNYSEEGINFIRSDRSSSIYVVTGKLIYCRTK